LGNVGEFFSRISKPGQIIVIHPVVVVPGGFAKSMTEAERQELLEKSREQLEFARFSIDFAKKNIFAKLDPETIGLGQITTGFLKVEMAVRAYDP
jgi:coenzyme F420-reducing hydrogenase alpha subunit